MKISIIYQDDDCLVVDKPAGLLSVPDRHDPTLPHLLQLLRRRSTGKILPVHRLDRGTSGLMVLAKSPEAQAALSAQFEQRTVEKIYLALVEGSPSPPQGRIEEPLAPHPAKAGKMMVSARGKRAESRYALREALSKDYSMLEVEIFTGRTHQIRVHLAYLGCPLLVDADYGNRAAFFLSSLKGRRFNLKQGTEERPLLARVPLHANQLAFRSPTDDKPLRFSVPPPKDMRATLNQLRKLGPA